MSSHDDHQSDQHRQTARVKLSSPTDILDIVPALLGFYPTESLCALYLEDVPAGRILGLTARFDLPTTPAEVTALLAHTADLLTRYSGAILVAYAADQEEARAVVRRIAEHSGPDKVITGVIAAPQGWTTVDPQHPAAVQWTNPYPNGTGPAAAAVAAAGFYAIGTRDDLRDSIATPDPLTAADYHRAAAKQNLPQKPTEQQVEQMAAEVREFIGNYLAQPLSVTVDDAAFLTGRVHHGAPRDAALCAIERRDAHLHATLWQGAATMTPDDHAAPILGLLGIAAWIAGNGALANLALERAHTSGCRTDQGLLGITRHAMENAIPPATWDEVKDGI